MAYGIKTVKADNSTIVLQNSNKSGVFARSFTCTAADYTYLNPAEQYSLDYYNKEFPEYNGRTLYMVVLKAGNSDPSLFKSAAGVNTLAWNIRSPSSYFVDPKFTVGLTTVYLFIK